jgi:prepilin-type processing-associated H-X9-DG protein
MMYAQDYDGTFPYNQVGYGSGVATPPGGYWAGDASTGIYMWPQIIDTYIKSFQIFRCPSGIDNNLYGNYGANDSILPNPPYCWSAVRQDSVDSASEDYFVMDYGSLEANVAQVTAPSGHNYLPGVGDLGTGSASSINSSSPDQRPDYRSGRHFGGVNMLFVDGHVKWLKGSVVISQVGADGGHGAWQDYYRTALPTCH